MAEACYTFAVCSERMGFFKICFQFFSFFCDHKNCSYSNHNSNRWKLYRNGRDVLWYTTYQLPVLFQLSGFGTQSAAASFNVLESSLLISICRLMAKFPVKLYVYDLSRGMARQLSPLILGKFDDTRRLLILQGTSQLKHFSILCFAFTL